MNTFKSIGAVIAGFFTVVILSIVTDSILEAIGFFPPISSGIFDTTLLLIAFAYRSVFTVLGGYVTASVSPNQPMRHVIILGSIGTVAGIAGAIVGWNLSLHWYPIALAVTGFLFTWLGGKLYMRRLQKISTSNLQ